MQYQCEVCFFPKFLMSIDDKCICGKQFTSSIYCWQISENNNKNKMWEPPCVFWLRSIILCAHNNNFATMAFGKSWKIYHFLSYICGWKLFTTSAKKLSVSTLLTRWYKKQHQFDLILAKWNKATQYVTIYNVRLSCMKTKP